MPLTFITLYCLKRCPGEKGKLPPAGRAGERGVRIFRRFYHLYARPAVPGKGEKGALRYPLSPEVLMPSTRKREPLRYRIMMGISISVAAAIRVCQVVVNWLSPKWL